MDNGVVRMYAELVEETQMGPRQGGVMTATFSLSVQFEAVKCVL